MSKRGYLRKSDYALVDADPVVYDVRAAHTRAGHPSYKQLRERTGLSLSTIRNALAGKTKRPQHATVSLLMFHGLGYTETWTRRGSPTIIVRPEKVRRK